MYDYVLMDTAPVGRVADPMSLNRIAKNTLFVVKYDSTELADIQESLEKLDRSGAKIVGCIVNGVKKIGKGSAYGYGYGRTYGRMQHRHSDQDAPSAPNAD